MRDEILKLRALGPWPDSNTLILENSEGLVEKYEFLILGIEGTVTDEESRTLLGILGPDDCFGLMWPVIFLIETAPGWPIWDVLDNSRSEGAQILRTRLENGGLVRPKHHL